MPSGTVHFVFRRSGGGQTLGFAGHLLRRNDLTDWLRNLASEVQFAIDEDDDDSDDERTQTPYLEVVPGLLGALLGMVDQAIEEDQADRFGGERKAFESITLIGRLIALLEQLEAKRNS